MAFKAQFSNNNSINKLFPQGYFENLFHKSVHHIILHLITHISQIIRIWRDLDTAQSVASIGRVNG